MKKLEKKSNKSLTINDVTFEMSLTRRNYEDINADGDIITVAKYYEFFMIKIQKEGKTLITSYSKPMKLIANDPNAKPGTVAKIENCYLMTDTYNQIMALYAEMMAETETEEITIAENTMKEKKEAETKKSEAEVREYKALMASGMCPKCGTWCYGDCEANK